MNRRRPERSLRMSPSPGAVTSCKPSPGAVTAHEPSPGGECVAIVGESGSGKSVTARTLVGLTGPGATVTAGRFTVKGQDALRFGPRDWRRLRGRFAGLVLQDALLSLRPAPHDR